MKKILILSIAVMVITACSKSDDNSSNTIDNKIVGKWQLVEIKDEGSPDDWQIVENGAIVEFHSNGDVITTPSNDGEGCELRTYQIIVVSAADDELIYYCNGEYNSTINFDISVENQLILKSIWVWSKFNRITNQD